MMLLGPAAGAPLSEWQQMVELNVLGLLYGAHAGSGTAEQRPQVVEPVEQVPHVRRGASFPVRMQVGQRGVLAVALEGRPGLPFDEDEHLPRSDVAGHAFPEPAQGHHASSVPGNLPGRPA